MVLMSVHQLSSHWILPSATEQIKVCSPSPAHGAALRAAASFAFTVPVLKVIAGFSLVNEAIS